MLGDGLVNVGCLLYICTMCMWLLFYFRCRSGGWGLLCSSDGVLRIVVCLFVSIVYVCTYVLCMRSGHAGRVWGAPGPRQEA
ncbi:hypothetical protein B0J11DRAFT_94502 [Dendryphion nanum]|uniref:Uncharacterized protein n=1 Tax=Dendryphion nanum TaxID=256645 RepID=A0A9P9DEW8_9PLEO|nr:hypothetical protein B0J11DRAFT_94502 [Dendryphion nanum]